MASIQPTVGSPDKGVQGFVRILITPAIQEDFGFAIRLIIAIAIRDDTSSKELHRPYTTESNF